jgi:UDP:flavonoid glycosyltransferase YjiC (YdhE family)
LRKWRNGNNILGDVPTIFSNFNPRVPYLVQSTPETDFPLTSPPNVHGCGPILPVLPANTNEQPNDLPPTILFNLGSHTTYTKAETMEILAAFEILLSSHPTLHITWKYQPANAATATDTLTSLSSDIASRITQVAWLPQTPLKILTQPSTILYIHHGGSNSFHEALAAGVPQVLCPRWLDTYEFATRAEWLGVGIMGNKHAAPGLAGNELAEAIESVIGSGAKERFAMRAMEVRNGLGRDADGFHALEGGRKRAARLIIEEAGLV